ncbi:MAG: thioredoxin-dependent thiol peroxidase [Rickettsiaceae bacterium H1]|nr:thioredoxin-dependent thiol peroxidase [Rickettsiaceae bacterium H1]
MIVVDKAPDFSLFSDNGEKISLSDLSGKNIILYFYPKDDTPGCTQEAKDFTILIDEFEKLSVTVIGISKDNINSHKNFKKKYNLRFTLLSDESAEAIKKYGSWVEKSMFGKKYMGIDRSTFLIDKDGVIIKIWRKVKVNGHAEKVLSVCKTELNN